MAGNASFTVDFDQLEREIKAKESNRLSQAPPLPLSGSIGSFDTGTKRPIGSAPIRPLSTEPGIDVEFNTLNEPVWRSVNRDLKVISAKFKQVLVPPKGKNVLTEWDLWGPLFICVVLSLILQGTASSKGPQFTQVFTLAFFGSCVVTLNIKLLGGKISFLQTMCVIGYCLLPSVFAALGCKAISVLLSVKPNIAMYLRLITAGAGFIWSTYASMAFLAGTQEDKRRLLGYFPIVLFYFVVSWLVIANT